MNELVQTKRTICLFRWLQNLRLNTWKCNRNERCRATCYNGTDLDFVTKLRQHSSIRYCSGNGNCKALKTRLSTTRGASWTPPSCQWPESCGGQSRCHLCFWGRPRGPPVSSIRWRGCTGGAGSVSGPQGSGGTNWSIRFSSTSPALVLVSWTHRISTCSTVAIIRYVGVKLGCFPCLETPTICMCLGEDQRTNSTMTHMFQRHLTTSSTVLDYSTLKSKQTLGGAMYWVKELMNMHFR